MNLFLNIIFFAFFGNLIEALITGKVSLFVNLSYILLPLTARFIIRPILGLELISFKGLKQYSEVTWKEWVAIGLMLFIFSFVDPFESKFDSKYWKEVVISLPSSLYIVLFFISNANTIRAFRKKRNKGKDWLAT